MRYLATVVICILFVCPIDVAKEQATAAVSTADQKAQATGKTIGTIVSSAFDTAFPIIGRIMDLFKKPANPAAATTDKKKPAAPSSVTESQVQDAITKAQADMKQSFKDEMKPTAAIAKELNVIQIFASGGAKASQNLASIKRNLAVQKPSYSKIQTEWKKFNAEMTDVMKLQKADIQIVREISIQGKLLEIQDSQRNLMIDITDNITRAATSQIDFSKPELEGQVSAMAALLGGLDSLAAAEIGLLQSDINSLAVWASAAPAAKGNFNAKLADPALLRIATVAITKGNNAISGAQANETRHQKKIE